MFLWGFGSIEMSRELVIAGNCIFTDIVYHRIVLDAFIMLQEALIDIIHSVK